MLKAPFLKSSDLHLTVIHLKYQTYCYNIRPKDANAHCMVSPLSDHCEKGGGGLESAFSSLFLSLSLSVCVCVCVCFRLFDNTCAHKFGGKVNALLLLGQAC